MIKCEQGVRKMLKNKVRTKTTRVTNHGMNRKRVATSIKIGNKSIPIHTTIKTK